MPDNVSKYGTAFDSLSVKPSVSQADASTHTPEETNFEVLRREQILREMRDCHSLRKGYLLASFIFVCLFVIAVLCLVVCAGCKILVLGDSALVAIVASMTATVVGILAIAFKWLFPRK